MKSLKIFVLIFTAIACSLQMNAMDSTSQEEFKVAIQQNNLLKVQNFLNNKDIDVNFVYSDNKNPFYISLENLETQVNQSLSTKIAAAVVSGLLSLIAGPKLVRSAKSEWHEFTTIKNATTTKKMKTVIDKKKEINQSKMSVLNESIRDLYVKAFGSAALTKEQEKELSTKLSIADQKIYRSNKAKLNNLLMANIDYNTILMTDTYINNYRQRELLSHRAQTVAYFLAIMGLIVGTFGLIWKSTKIYNSIMNAQKIALMIRNHPKFKQDLQSAEFIRKTLPKYMNLLKAE